MKRIAAWLARRHKEKAPALPATAPPSKPATSQGGVVVVTVLGLGGEALEQVLDLVQRECRALGRKPVFVTDGCDFAPFRRRKLIVEQVPDGGWMTARAPDLPVWLYEERLFGLIGRRWRPSAVVHFGRRPREACVVALCAR